MGSLSIAQKHVVQIARALVGESRVLILDEPTASLSQRECAELFRIARKLRDAGCALLFITHKFDEIFELADRYAVFRDGASVGEGLLAATDRDALIRLMVGRPVEQLFPKHESRLGDELLRVENLGRDGQFEGHHFRAASRRDSRNLWPGGRRPYRARAGAVRCRTRDRGSAAASSGSSDIALVPEDRQNQGSILPFSIAANIALPNLAALAPRGWLRARREQELARHWIDALGIKAQGPAQAVQNLSGGNQQKVVIAKWLARKPAVLILDEPTKGIDVGAKAAVHAVTSEFAAAGNGVILISSELPEIIAMSDRVLVMRRGRLHGRVHARGCHQRKPAARGERRMSVLGNLRSWSDTARRDLTLGALTLALLVAVTLAFPGFAAPRNLAGVLDDTAILIMLALGQMLVILVRGVDLSVAANLALCGMLAALFNRAFPGAGVAPVLLLTLVSGALLGAFNGILVWKLRLPPIVVTLGTMSVYRGVIYLLSRGAWVNENEMSAEFVAFTRAQFLGLSTLAWLAIALTALAIVALRHTRIARNLYAAGGNPEAAAYSGIDVGRMQFIAYVISGAHRRPVRLPVGGALCGGLHRHSARLRAAGDRCLPDRRGGDHGWRGIRGRRGARLPVPGRHPQ